MNIHMKILIRKKLPGVIWKLITSLDGKFLVLDLRNEGEKTVKHVLMDVASLEEEYLPYEGIDWWSSLEAYDGTCFISEYMDQNDPTHKKVYQLSGREKVEIDVARIPDLEVEIMSPYLYEVGTEYHQITSTFLSLSLPLSCEYLEFKGNIIMSYYIRSGKVYDRYILIIKEGKKVFKEKQDTGIAGFAAGAFFGLNNSIIFIKNRNEICIYPAD